MTKTLLRTVLCILAALTSACSSETLIEEQGGGKQITMTAQDFHYADESRTSITITPEGGKFLWAANDTVGIFPNEGAQVFFPMTKGAGAKTASFNGGGWALKPASTYAAYYPYRVEQVNPQKIDVNFDKQQQIGNSSTTHIGKYDYMVAQATMPQEGRVLFNFKHIACLIELSLNVPQKGDVTSVGLSCDEKIFINKGYCDLTTSVPFINAKNKQNSIFVSLKDVRTTVDGSTIKVYFMMAPSDFTNKNINIELINNGKVYKEPINMGILEAGKAYRYSFSTDLTTETATTFHVNEPGTLPNLIGEANKFKYTQLKITGRINGTDIAFLREIIKEGDYDSVRQLQDIDLYDASIVSGGDAYYTDNIYEQSHFTEENVLGAFMFYRCGGLRKIVLPKGITSIGQWAFGYCSKLTEILVPNSVSYIDDYTFVGCEQMKIVNLPNNLQYLGNYAFRECYNIQSFYSYSSTNDCRCVIINNELLAYATGLNDKTFDVPSNVTRIGKNVFKNSNLATVNIPQSVIVIDDEAFYGCSKMSSITLPNSIKQIGDNAFYGTGITSITIPTSVEKVGDEICSGCTKLENFYGKYASSDNMCLIVHGRLVDIARGRKIKEYKIPEEVYYIGKGVFSSTKITNISLPQNLIEIGDYAFAYCFYLKSINIPNGVKRIGERAFYQCDSFTEIIIPESVNHIGNLFIYHTGQVNIFKAIYCYAQIPPEVDGELIHISDRIQYDRKCDIYVPAEYLQNYRISYPWSRYNILPITKN